MNLTSIITIAILINYIIVIFKKTLKVYSFCVCYFSQEVSASNMRQIKILIATTARDELQTSAFY